MDVILGGTVPLAEALASLEQRRPVFHSEADFQFALAWQIQLLDPELNIRLETRLGASGLFGSRGRLDLLVGSPDWSRRTAVELKYPTGRWTGTVAGETFDLAESTAEDIVRYDILKDVVRVEGYVDSNSGADGAVIVLTNAGAFWRPPPQVSTANDREFRIHDGVVLGGTRAWDPKAGAGTTRGREKPISIRGTYPCVWNEFSAADGFRGEFRILVVSIGSASDGSVT